MNEELGMTTQEVHALVVKIMMTEEAEKHTDEQLAEMLNAHPSQIAMARAVIRELEKE